MEHTLRKKGFHRLSIIIASILFLSGCQERTPLELSADQLASDLEVISLQPLAESALAKPLVDTTGVLNSEESKYFGTMFVSGVKYDVGTSHQTVSYSKVSFSDKSQPVEPRGKRIGYKGVDVGKVQLDGMDMVKVQKLIHLPDVPVFGNPDTAVGPQYILANRNGRDAKDFNFRYNSRFDWRVTGNGPVRPFTFSLRTPDELTITSPKATSVISKNENLRVEWQGKAESFQLIISGMIGSEVQPILQINVKKEGGDVTIPAKVLALLPTESTRTFVFSFISSSSAKLRTNEFPDDILAVAASVHNLVLTVQ